MQSTTVSQSLSVAASPLNWLLSTSAFKRIDPGIRPACLPLELNPDQENTLHSGGSEMGQLQTYQMLKCGVYAEECLYSHTQKSIFQPSFRLWYVASCPNLPLCP